MGVASDNAASVSFEGLVGNLLQVGVVDLSKLRGDFQYIPYEGLSEEVARIQELKFAFFERFWEPSGRVAVRTLAATAAEVGSFRKILPFEGFVSLAFGEVFIAQETMPSQPSEDGRSPGAGASPSGREASGAPGAQV